MIELGDIIEYWISQRYPKFIVRYKPYLSNLSPKGYISINACGINIVDVTDDQIYWRVDDTKVDTMALLPSDPQYFKKLDKIIQLSLDSIKINPSKWEDFLGEITPVENTL